jgi:hypothetical protein
VLVFLSSVGELFGCLAALASIDSAKLATTDLLELVMAPVASGPGSAPRG